MDNSIPLSYIRIWCRKNKCSASIQLKSSDQYLIDARGIFILLPDGTVSAVNPRYAFAIVDDYPSLKAADLHMPGANSQPLVYGQSITGNRKPMKATFAEIALYVENYLSLLGKLSRIEKYLAVRASETDLISVLQMNAALNGRQPGETLGSALLRMDFCTWDRLLSACLDCDRSTLHNPSSTGSQPLSGFELSGEILVALDKITRTQLESALHRKRQARKPLGEMLIKMGACSENDVKKCLAVQDGLNQSLSNATSKLGEMLVRHGGLTQEALDEALKMQQLGRQPLHMVLNATGACGKTSITSYKRERRIPESSEDYDEEDLGDYLLRRGMISPKQLEEAQTIKNTGRQLLGELLLKLNRCHPDDVELALNLQRHRRRMDPMAKPEKLGDMLVSRNLADKSQIDQATRAQALGKQQLGVTLVGLGVCSQQDFADALELQYSWREQLKGFDDRLGQEMVRHGFLKPAAVEQALKQQSQFKRPLGAILLEQHGCPPEQIIEVLLKRDEQRRQAFQRLLMTLRSAT